MSIRVSGLDKLQKQLSEATKAFRALEGEIARLSFDPNDKSSVDAALKHMERAIDQKAAPYRGNSLVEHVSGQLKRTYRAAILDRASAESRPDNEVQHEA